MKKLLAIMLALVMVLAMVPALADEPVLQGYCGGDEKTEWSETITGKTWVYDKQTGFSTNIYKNVRWRLDKNGTDTYTLTLSGSGKMADYLAGSVRPWKDYASKITKLIVEDGVSSVGSRTCYNFTVLTDISLADTVTDIGEFSFSGCSALVSVDLSNVTSIRPNALRDDRALSDIRLSRDLKVIDYQAFRDSGADNSSISIPASVTDIGFGAFNGAKFTNVLNLPNVKKVGAFAFSNSKFAAVVLTNAELEIVSGKEADKGKEYDNSVFSSNEAVFYTSVSSVMDKLYDNNRENNVGIIACTNGGSFTPDTKFGGFTLAEPQKDGYAFAGWFSDPDLTEKEGLSEENGTYTGTPTTDIHADGRRYYAKWIEKPISFDANGGTGTMPNEDYIVNQLTDTESSYSIRFPACTFTAPAGQEFAGWKITEPDNLVDNTVYPAGGEKNIGKEAYANVTVTAQWKAKQPEQPQPSENPNPSPSTDPSASPTPTPTPYNGGGGNGGGHYYPTTTPVPVIVIPPKTGDMTIWQSILHFLGIR